MNKPIIDAIMMKMILRIFMALPDMITEKNRVELIMISNLNRTFQSFLCRGRFVTCPIIVLLSIRDGLEPSPTLFLWR